MATLRARGPGMVLIPGGTFEIGSSPLEIARVAADCQRELGAACPLDWFMNEQPRRRARLGAFWLDRHEVTVSDYARCTDLGGCRPLTTDEGRSRYFSRGDHPVTFVRFEDALRYCAFRNARLPLEAEYERAARGLTGRVYPWGNLYHGRLSNHGRAAPVDLMRSAREANLFRLVLTDERDGFAELAPVSALLGDQTPQGVADLAGNVAEWTLGHYGDLPAAREVLGEPAPEPAKDFRLVQAKAGRQGERLDPDELRRPQVVRGGDFTTASVWLRGASRRQLDPRAELPTVGFRCARSAERAF
jgi:formylglycine-generating enzyme required for sulfatase activity